MSTKYCSSSSVSTINSEQAITSRKTSYELSPEITYTNILLHILNKNQKLPDYNEKIEQSIDGHFKRNKKQSISLLDYLKRILKYIEVENNTLILSLIYIDRICKEKVFLNEFNIHRIMFISIIMAYLYNEDETEEEEDLAMVGGISLKEMIILEHDFIDLIDFNFYVDEKIFEEYKNKFLSQSDK